VASDISTVAALFVSITSATFTGFNYFKSALEQNQKHMATKDLIALGISEGENITQRTGRQKTPINFAKKPIYGRTG
jgi:hypothetical protein